MVAGAIIRMCVGLPGRHTAAWLASVGLVLAESVRVIRTPSLSAACSMQLVLVVINGRCSISVGLDMSYDRAELPLAAGHQESSKIRRSAEAIPRPMPPGHVAHARDGLASTRLETVPAEARGCGGRDVRAKSPSIHNPRVQTGPRQVQGTARKRLPINPRQRPVVSTCAGWGKSRRCSLRLATWVIGAQFGQPSVIHRGPRLPGSALVPSVLASRCQFN